MGVNECHLISTRHVRILDWVGRIHRINGIHYKELLRIAPGWVVAGRIFFFLLTQ